MILIKIAKPKDSIGEIWDRVDHQLNTKIENVRVIVKSDISTCTFEHTL